MGSCLKMKLTLILFFLLPALISSFRSVIRKHKVVAAERTFRCTFVLIHTNNKVDLKKSTVSCTGADRKIPRAPVTIYTTDYKFQGAIKINNPKKPKNSLIQMTVTPKPEPATTEGPATTETPEEIPWDELNEMFIKETANISSKEVVTAKPGCGQLSKEFQEQQTRGYTTSDVTKWKDAKIAWSFVSIDDSFAKFSFMKDAKIGLSGAEVAVVKKAMKQIEEKTCIKFNLVKPEKGKTWLAITREATTKTNQCQAEYIANAYGGKDVNGLGDVFWGQFDTCFSGAYAYMGSRPGKNQLMVISAMSLSEEQQDVGIVVHELLHNLGVGHTQKRSDQEENIKVIWDNIQDNPSAKFQYTKCQGTGCQNLDTPYDCSSVMHYGVYGFSKNGKATMEAVDKTKCNLESGKIRLSETDITLLKKMYCDGKADEKLVTSPNYPKNYPDNQNVAITLDAGTGNIVEIKFTDMNIESHATCSADYVKVVDADSTVLLKETCGTALPSKISSKTPKVTVTFRSDGNKNYKGFRAEWKAVKKTVAVDGNWSGWSTWSKCTNKKETKSKCNKKAVRYCNNPAASNGGTACQGSSDKSLACTDYDLSNPSQNPECVVEGGWSDWGSPSTCNAQCKTSRTRTCDNPPPINHKTCDGDNSKTESCTGGSCSNSVSGVITSPNHPNNYPVNQDTTQTIEVAIGSRIELTFTAFDIEDDESCTYDYVQVFDTDGKSLAKKCGSKTPEAIESTCNKLTVKFHSDDYLNKKGYKAEWKKIEATNSGQIKTPNYPKDYPEQITKIYNLKVVAGSRVKLTFNDFNVEYHGKCEYDYVEVNDSNGQTIGKKLCGTTKPEPITSTGNSMTVKFVSDYYDTRKGFVANWEKV